jgi:tetratricopeptide (TPR) repeat protein
MSMNFDKWRHYFRARLFELLRMPDLALDEYHRCLAIDPDFRRAANALAFRYALAGRHAEACRFFEVVLRLDANDAVAHFNLGFNYEKNHEARKAIERFRSAVGLEAKLDRAWYGMGLAHASLGEHREAMEAFGQAATLQPMGGQAWYQLGMACHHAHEPKRLREVIHHLHRFDPLLARRLILETGTTDLAHLVKDLVV